jgi:hypothetical protein
MTHTTCIDYIYVYHITHTHTHTHTFITKYGPLTSCMAICVTWELVKSMNSWAHPRLIESDTAEVHPRELCFNRLLSVLTEAHRFENLCILGKVTKRQRWRRIFILSLSLILTTFFNFQKTMKVTEAENKQGEKKEKKK